MASGARLRGRPGEAGPAARLHWQARTTGDAPGDRRPRSGGARRRPQPLSARTMINEPANAEAQITAAIPPTRARRTARPVSPSWLLL